jgi:hypothetical protein
MPHNVNLARAREQPQCRLTIKIERLCYEHEGMTGEDFDVKQKKGQRG